MPENVESVTEDILKETRNIYISAQSLIRRLCDRFEEPPRDLIDMCEDIISKVYSLTEVQMQKVSDKTDEITAHMETLVELLHETNNKSPDDLATLIKKCNDISQRVTKIRAYADVALHSKKIYGDMLFQAC
ncbi:hypothetical protein [Candidatus Endomicrobiellum agilis]|uniref:hypothetical protein n=1 Tax=Candidatus Endomicrobiellum agilis TaxID=3238957 RepID=UPI0035894B81|nr:hypothetical protein [Endomicrobium sp.]